MLENQIMEFVESVEPDFRYQGTEGMMNIISESAYNMVLMESAINNSEYTTIQEGMIGDFFGAIWARIKKFFNWIVGIVKKVIAKIKAFFMAIRRKLTLAAAAALRKIGDVIRSNVNMDKQGGDDKDKEVKYKSINLKKLEVLKNNLKEAAKYEKDEIDEYRAAITGGVFKYCDKLDNESDVTAAKKRIDDDSEEATNVDKINENALKELLANVVDDKDIDAKNIISSIKDALLVDDGITPSNDAFKSAFSGKIVSAIDDTYKAAMKLYSDEFSILKQMQSEITKDVKKITEASAKDKNLDDKIKRRVLSVANYSLSKMFKLLNITVNCTHQIAAKVAQAVASTSMTSYKSLLGAVLRGLSRRTSYSKNESVEYNFL